MPHNFLRLATALHIKSTTPKDSLRHKFMNYIEQSKTQEHCRWLSTVKFILKLCNLDYVWEDPTKTKHVALITKGFNHLVKRYFNFWHDRVNNDVWCCPSKKPTQRGNKPRTKPTQRGNKPRTYKLIKNYYKMETYLYHISDREVRRDLTKLRGSNHSFLIEQGRYSKLEVGKLLYKKMKKVEDEIHFLIESKLYDSVRKKSISDNNIISIDGNTRDTFIYCLNNKNKSFILNVTKFTTACFELRKIFSNCNII